MKNIIKIELDEHIKIAKLLYSLTDDIAAAAQICIDSINRGGKILLLGNGGSAADAQHIAAELVGRYKADRKSLPAIALTTDSSVLTSISNDFGYDNVFKRQIEGIANKGDVVIGLSTSGRSTNVIKALKLSLELDCKTISFSGEVNDAIKDVSDINLAAPSRDTPRIQEMHIVIGHTICHLIEQAF